MYFVDKYIQTLNTCAFLIIVLYKIKIENPHKKTILKYTILNTESSIAQNLFRGFFLLSFVTEQCWHTTQRNKTKTKINH